MDNRWKAWKTWKVWKVLPSVGVILALAMSTITLYSSGAGYQALGTSHYTSDISMVSADIYLEGNELYIDADDDTHITADTDDQIDVAISGADDFRFTANTFTALSGSTVAADTIAETTSGNGVAVDGLRIRDSGIAANVAITGTASVGGDITFANGTTLGEAVDTVLDLSEFLAFTEQTAVVVGTQTSITPTGTYQPITSGAAVSTSLTTAILDGTVNGQLLVLVNENAADAIIVVDGANTEMGGDKTLTGGQGDTLWLMWDGSDWLCIGYNDN